MLQLYPNIREATPVIEPSLEQRRLDLLSRMCEIELGEESLESLFASLLEIAPIEKTEVYWVHGVLWISEPNLFENKYLSSFVEIDRIRSIFGRSLNTTPFLNDPLMPSRRIFSLVSNGDLLGFVCFNVSSHCELADEKFLLLFSQFLKSSLLLPQNLLPSLHAKRHLNRLNDGAKISGRLAHDYDNLWTGIVGFVELTTPLLPEQSEARQYINELSKIGARGIQMTQDLHSFSRSGTPKPHPSEIGSVIRRELKNRTELSGSPFEFQADLQPDLPKVMIESGIIQQILSRLLDNAMESMPKGGKIIVQASCEFLSELQLKDYRNISIPGEYILLKIKDNGHGMKSDVLAQCLNEMFFTTRVRHRGLGLAIVQRMVYTHGGGIAIQTELNHGTTVLIAFPQMTSHRHPVETVRLDS